MYPQQASENAYKDGWQYSSNGNLCSKCAEKEK